MKKIIFFCAMLCTILSVKSQCLWTYVPCNEDTLNMRQYEDRYLFNYCRREGLNLDVILPSEQNISDDAFEVVYGLIRPYTVLQYPYNIITDYAQPYIVDTAITIAGVSGYVFHNFDIIHRDKYQCYKWYFEIWDSTLTNILRSVDITDTSGERYHFQTPYYTEVFFDEPLTISGKFYVVYHTPDTLNIECPIIYSSAPIGVGGNVMGTSVCSPITELHPLVTTWSDGKIDDGIRTWSYIGKEKNVFTGESEGDTITMLYLFPILADTTNGGVTSSDTTTSSLENINGLESIRVFPNPAENEVNINSGYRIERIFLYDESSKLLQEKEVKAYNCKIDLHSYPQGSYLLKVQTTKNQTTHKIIRQ